MPTGVISQAELQLVLQDYLKRIRVLEANLGGGVIGIRFNVNNTTDSVGNPADFLFIETNGTGPTDGISLINSSDTGGIGILVENNNDDPFVLKQTGNGGMTFENDGTGPMVISSLGGSGGDTSVETTHGTVVIGTSGTAKDMTFYVKDGNIHWMQGGLGGSDIMALLWNGAEYDLHLQAGATIVYDL